MATQRNEADMVAEILSLCPDNTAGEVAPADIRSLLEDIVRSSKNTASVISGAVVGSIGVTTTPTKLLTFDTNQTLANENFTPDQANNRITILTTGFYTFGLNFIGEWPNADNLILEVRKDGLSFPTPIFIEQDGAGSGRPISVSTSSGRPIQVADTPPTQMEVYISGTGSFNVDQLQVLLSSVYTPWTIDAVG